MISADEFYRVVEGRRDIREGFLPEPVADDVLTRILAAAHRGPSVGLTQPWDFLIIRDAGRRRAVQVLAERQRLIYEATLTRPRAQRFDRLKIEAILEAPVNVVVTCDPTRGGRNPLGRHSQPQMAAYSVACAVQNLWLAARAEEIGVGWVSFFDERELAAELGLPDHLQIVAYLCVGHVAEFPPAPQLALTGWARRRPLSWAVHNETYGNRGLPGEESMNLIDETIAAIRPLDDAAMRAARRASGPADQAAGLARGVGGAVDPARRAGGGVPAADAGAGRHRDLRRRPRGARAGRHAVAAGGHRPDGGELPRGRRGRERVRPRRSALRWSSSTSA